MIDVIKNIGSLSFRLPDELSGLDGKNRAVMLDDVVSILEEYQRKQPKTDCSECSRRKFYQQGYQDGLNADKWIPCEERLPEEPKGISDIYLITDEYVGMPYTAYWDGEKWINARDNVIDTVIAWQPLPQPYKKEGAE